MGGRGRKRGGQPKTSIPPELECRGWGKIGGGKKCERQKKRGKNEPSPRDLLFPWGGGGEVRGEKMLRPVQKSKGMVVFKSLNRSKKKRILVGNPKGKKGGWMYSSGCSKHVLYPFETLEGRKSQREKL